MKIYLRPYLVILKINLVPSHTFYFLKLTYTKKKQAQDIIPIKFNYCFTFLSVKRLTNLRKKMIGAQKFFKF
jgi:hypothetical protein